MYLSGNGRRRVHPSVMAIMEQEHSSRLPPPLEAPRPITEGFISEAVTDGGQTLVIEAGGLDPIWDAVVPVGKTHALILNEQDHYRLVRIDEGVLGDLVTKLRNLASGFFKKLAVKLGFRTPDELKEFQQSYRKDPKAAMSYMEKRLGEMGHDPATAARLAKEAQGSLNRLDAGLKGLKSNDQAAVRNAVHGVGAATQTPEEKAAAAQQTAQARTDADTAAKRQHELAMAKANGGNRASVVSADHGGGHGHAAQAQPKSAGQNLPTTNAQPANQALPANPPAPPAAPKPAGGQAAASANPANPPLPPAPAPAAAPAQPAQSAVGPAGHGNGAIPVKITAVYKDAAGQDQTATFDSDLDKYTAMYHDWQAGKPLAVAGGAPVKVDKLSAAGMGGGAINITAKANPAPAPTPAASPASAKPPASAAGTPAPSPAAPAGDQAAAAAQAQPIQPVPVHPVGGKPAPTGVTKPAPPAHSRRRKWEKF